MVVVSSTSDININATVAAVAVAVAAAAASDSDSVVDSHVADHTPSKGTHPLQDKEEDKEEDTEEENHDNNNDDVDEEWRLWKSSRKRAKLDMVDSKGLFLETINRYMLDFDFERLCSVSLSNLNVYACLVCGKYFQGRGPATHAYLHSFHEDHHVFINLETLKTYILPDGNEVMDSSLNDIKFIIKPSFTREQVQNMDKNTSYSYDLNNKRYLPGFVGLNNIKANDYINVIIQALSHIAPLRDFFLLKEPTSTSELCQRFGLLMRKMWNPRAFKGQVSPHELLQQVSNVSKKRFLLSQQADPIDFLIWFLNTIHAGLGGTKKIGSIVHDCFQGEVRVESRSIDSNKEPITTTTTPFLFLALDLPPPPLFQEDLEKSIIPQVPLVHLLTKFDGVTWKEFGTTAKRMTITKLPNYLVFHVKRFSKNNFIAKEKNPTIVSFPIKGLDMSEYTDGEDDGDGDVEAKYDLVANICHEGGRPGAELGSYKIHVHSKGRDQWFQIQDLFVEEIAPQMIFLSESYIQIWERVKE